MNYPRQFIYVGPAYSTRDVHVPAPMFRRAFQAGEVHRATIRITGLGFYELYVNGKTITKGRLAPYITAPSDIVFYDEYDVTALLETGDNAIGVLLGNGLMNNPGGYVWDFEQAAWRGAPRFALTLTMEGLDGKTETLQSDESFVTAPSAILFDDYRYGEIYDARLETPGWQETGFDASAWKPALRCESPVGEARMCTCEPVRITGETPPISVKQTRDGWLYDFGVNQSGVCRLQVKGEAGQEITLYHGELLSDGTLDRRNIRFAPHPYAPDDMVQRDIYICSGNGMETYTPTFTYHGFRYVLVKGITPEQATPALLTYLVMHSDLAERGGFTCSDPIANTLQEITRRSDLSNFFYFPNDCPQREKNGWTADAALSSEHLLLNLAPERSYRDWLACIRKAQLESGALPGIIPTGGWGFAWGNGPAWDNVLFILPYNLYLYRGDREVILENTTAMLRYLHYISTRVDADGLIEIGLGDWCPVGREADAYKAPLRLTDTILTADIAEKAAFLWGEVGLFREQAYAHALYVQLRQAVRTRLLDLNTMTAEGSCQTAQAMAIYYHMFEPGEKPEAFHRLLQFIHMADDHMDVGVLGARVIFHVLTAFGHSDLAYRMITREDYPSYGDWVRRGATTLWEMFIPEDKPYTASMNHHFWGDISSWLMQAIAGIRMNPTRHSVHEVDIRPAFIAALTHAAAWHEAPDGRIDVRWAREENSILLTVIMPESMKGTIHLPDAYQFEDGALVKKAATGGYRITAR